MLFSTIFCVFYVVLNFCEFSHISEFKLRYFQFEKLSNCVERWTKRNGHLEAITQSIAEIFDQTSMAISSPFSIAQAVIIFSLSTIA